MLTANTYITVITCIPIIIMLVLSFSAANALASLTQPHASLRDTIFICNIMLLIIFTCMILGSHIILRDYLPKHRIAVASVFLFQIFVGMSLHNADPSIILMWTLIGGIPAWLAFVSIITPHFTDAAFS